MARLWGTGMPKYGTSECKVVQTYWKIGSFQKEKLCLDSVKATGDKTSTPPCKMWLCPNKAIVS